MARKTKMGRRIIRQSQEQKLMHRWWVRLLLALAFFGLAYGFISLAINSGRLIEYGIGLVLIWYAFKHVLRAIRNDY